MTWGWVINKKKKCIYEIDYPFKLLMIADETYTIL